MKIKASISFPENGKVEDLIGLTVLLDDKGLTGIITDAEKGFYSFKEDDLEYIKVSFADIIIEVFN